MTETKGFHFEPGTHAYTYDGKKMTGVTTVIGVLAKPALIGWAAKMAVIEIEAAAKYHDIEGIEHLGILAPTKEEWDALMEKARTAHTKKKEAAGEAGTDMHALVEAFIGRCIELNAGAPQDMGLEVDQPIEKFVAWAKANVKTFLFAERRMFDKELFIAGTADFAYIGKDGNKYMADFKTSSGIYGIDYWLQTAAYRMLAEGEGDEPYDGCMVVRMGKDGSFEVNQLNEYVLYREAFLACLKLYRLQAHNKPEVKEKTWGTNLKTITL